MSKSGVQRQLAVFALAQHIVTMAEQARNVRRLLFPDS